jgi:bleomycin hydrolase
MKRVLLLWFYAVSTFVVHAQEDPSREASPQAVSRGTATGEFVTGKKNFATPVKDQARTGTCWSFSTTSMLESQVVKNKLGTYDLSEMYTVRNIYVEKARNYILRQGHTQFSEGGLGHDVIRAIATYGAVPESVYAGLKGEGKSHDHGLMFKDLKRYLDSTLKIKSFNSTSGWLDGYTKILDQYLGPLPEGFKFNNRHYTPKSFAKEALGFREEDYVNITSFTHHPYYAPFIIEVPDNFSNGAYYNLPLNEMTELVKTALNNGYTILWDADVSNNGFRHKKGLALNLDQQANIAEDSLRADMTEVKYDEKTRQQLFENLVTQDDHLMHITGIEKSKGGKTFFIVKNSWGEGGPFGGYVNVSEAYFAVNTISLVVPKAAISKSILDKLKIQ